MEPVGSCPAARDNLTEGIIRCFTGVATNCFIHTRRRSMALQVAEKAANFPMLCYL